MEDIYDNLDNYNYEELLKENKALKSRIEVINSKLSNLQEEYDKVNSEYKKLELHYSSLLKTAKAEVQRKTQMINKLNAEKDEIIIQYLGNQKNRYPFSAKNNSNQIKKAVNTKNKAEEGKISANAEKLSQDDSKRNESQQPSNKNKSRDNKTSKSEQAKNTQAEQNTKADKENVSSKKQHKEDIKENVHREEQDRNKSQPCDKNKGQENRTNKPKETQNIEAKQITKGDKENISGHKEDTKETIIRDKAQPRLVPNSALTSIVKPVLNKEKSNKELRTSSSPQNRSDGEIIDDESTSAKSSRKSENEVGGGDYRKRSNSPSYHDNRVSNNRSRHSRHYDNIDSSDRYKNSRSKSRAEQRQRHRSRGNYEQRDNNGRRDYDRNEYPSRRTDSGRSGHDKNISDRRRGESPSREAYRSRAKSRQSRSNCYDVDNDTYRYNEPQEHRTNKRKIDSDEYIRNKISKTEESRDPFANTVYKKLDEASNPFLRFSETNHTATSRGKSQESHINEQPASHQIEDNNAVIHHDEDRARELGGKDFVLPPLFEDPRLVSKRYVEVSDARNIVHITRALEPKIDLKALKYDATLKHVVPMPKSCLDIGEDNINEIYMDIDREILNLSGESGEYIEQKQESKEGITCNPPSNEISKLFNEKTKAVNNNPAVVRNIHPPTSPATTTHIESNPQSTRLSLSKYKIPKKGKDNIDNCDQKTVKSCKVIVNEEATVHIPKSCETRQEDQNEHKIENKKIGKNVSGEVDVLRMEDDDPYHLEVASLQARQQMIEGDLELSDENSNDVTNNSAARNDIKECLPTFGKKLHEESLPESHKVKDIKAKFTDLFGETSLITPEDLDLCPKPALNLFEDTNSIDVEEAIIDIDFSKRCKKLMEKDKEKSDNEIVKEGKRSLEVNNKIEAQTKLQASQETSIKEIVKDKLLKPQDTFDTKLDNSNSNTPNVSSAMTRLEHKIDTLETTKISPIIPRVENVTTEAPALQNSTPDVGSDIPKADLTLVYKRRRNILRKPNPTAR